MRSKDTPKKASGPMLYVPERVFFYNLFRCCQCEPSTLFDEINETMLEDIRECQYAIECQIDNVAKKDLPARENKHILPSIFIKYVESKSQQKSKKAGDYVLTKCHRKIYDAERSIRLSNKTRNYKPTDTGEDKKILKKFEDFFSVSEALSERQFYRILRPYDEVQNDLCSERKTYSTDLNYIVRFTISKVFPKMHTPYGKSFLAVLTASNWQEIVYMFRVKKRVHSNVISVDNDNCVDFERCMQHCFDKLKEFILQPNLEDPSLIDAVGAELLKMYDTICDYNNKGKISGIRYASTSPEDSSKVSIPKRPHEAIADDAKFKYDAEISSHIQNFMRWIHMPPIDDYKFMESVDRIIERIREQVFDKIDSSFTLEEFCSCRKTDCPSNSLFLWRGNTDLLYQLIDAMHNESFIYSANIKIGGKHE